LANSKTISVTVERRTVKPDLWFALKIATEFVIYSLLNKWVRTQLLVHHCGTKKTEMSN
jgi:hypothetical protein